MTDLLDRVAGPAFDLLERIDASLDGFGAPADHPVWPLSRRLGALPTAAVEHFFELTPDAVREAGERLREVAGSCRDEAAAGSPTSWRGATADEYESRWVEICAYLAGDGDSLAGHLDATASYLLDLADWIAGSRRHIAGELAACLGASETVALRRAGEPNLGIDRAAIVVAADLGARVLDVVAQCVDDGWRVRQRWAGALGEVTVRTSAALQPSHATHIEYH